MNNSYIAPDVKKKSGIFLKAAGSGIVVTLLAMLIFAAIMLWFGISQKYAVALATVSVAIGSFAAAFYAARKINVKGYKIGFLAGVVTFIIITAVSLIISKNGVTYNTLFHFIIIMISSLIGGILGVNFQKDKKYI
ncbi:MAG: TIGR04086 family membrane protein [Oscillospiraceae bacterium]|nr:TIGR04086 family membrane protein [Oscillospiraceae bacterium]